MKTAKKWVLIATSGHSNPNVKLEVQIMFEPWQLAMIDDAGYNGIRDEHIDRVAESLLATGLTEIDRSTFDYQCHKCGIDPNNFTQADLDRLQEALNK